MRSLFDLLENVEQRPSMYLGWDERQLDRRWLCLEAMLIGYELALVEHGVEDPGKDFMRRFGAYLRARFGWSMSCGPLAAIRDHAANHRRAFEEFWKLLAEFKRAEDERA